MKIQKLILPALVLVILALLYFSYFSPKDELGKFSDFDKNSNANRDIFVEYVSSKGVIQDKANAASIFYVKDATGMEVKVMGPIILPPGMDISNRITLRGHLHGDYFHASEVVIRN